MIVHFTQNAHSNLATIYDYHVDYSLPYADKFYAEITAYIAETLVRFPEIGVMYNQEKNLRKLVFNKRYNTYYIIQNGIVYVLYIIDAKLYLNMELQEPDAKLPSLA